MDWDDLRVVLAVARAGSVGDAARALGVAHSTVYRRITAFEEAHDVRLFERLPSGYVATDSARELVELAQALEQKVSAAERRLLAKDRTASGEVTLTAPEAFGPKLAALLPDFKRTFPEIVLALRLASAPLDLARREADVALRVASNPPGELVGRRLATVAYAVYAAETEARELDDPGLAFVVLVASAAATPQGRWEASHVPDERVAARSSGRLAFVDAVISGVGAGVMPCGLADQEPGLRRLGPPIAELALPLWILVHPDVKDVPRIRATFDFFAERIQSERNLLEGSG